MKTCQERNENMMKRWQQITKLIMTSLVCQDAESLHSIMEVMMAT